MPIPSCADIRADARPAYDQEECTDGGLSAGPSVQQANEQRPRGPQPIADILHHARKLGGDMRIARSQVSR